MVKRGIAACVSFNLLLGKGGFFINIILDETICNVVVDYRKTLHQIPETAFNEFKTRNFLKTELVKLGFSAEEVAKTGLIAYKKGQSNGAVAFRADMDALNVTEKTGVDYISKHEGVMHACAHDGHMSILLGLARYCSDKALKKDLVLIFQPAEEGPGGAEIIVKEGYLKKHNVEKIFGLHIFPEIPEGKIGLKSGVLMGQVGEFSIDIQTRSGHAAMPHQGRDAIYISSLLIQAYQGIIARSVDPTEGAVLSVGKIMAGKARNIIAGKSELEGTIRAFNEKVYSLIKERMKTINAGMEKMFDCVINTTFMDMYPPLVNNDDLYLELKTIFHKEEITEIKPLMISEDFAYYVREVPGFFIMLGSRNESKGYVHPLHNCYFNFSEEVLYKGLKIVIKLAQHFNVL